MAIAPHPANRRKADSVEEWEQLSREKLEWADLLAKNPRLRSLAYEQYGYAVECAIKALIMRQQGLNRWPDYADRPELYSHGLNSLMKQTRLFQKFCQDRQNNRNLRTHWLVVKDWSQSRYDMIQPSGTVIRDIRLAITHPTDGIIQWLKNQ